MGTRIMENHMQSTTMTQTTQVTTQKQDIVSLWVQPISSPSTLENRYHMVRLMEI